MFLDWAPILMTCFILTVHFFADFIVQTKWQQENKYNNDWALFYHLCTYTLVWVPIVWVFSHKVEAVIGFCGFTMAIHGFIDLTSSMFTHKAFLKEQNARKGFQLVYIDQFLHIAQLLVCWKLFVI